MAGLSLFLVLLGGVVVLLVAGPKEYVAPPPDTVVRRAHPDLAVDALDRRVDALGSGDGDEAATLAPAGDRAVADLLRAGAANAKALDVTDLGARYVEEVGAVAADGSWHALVELTWRFEGYDDKPITQEVEVGFAPAGDDAVAVTSVGGGERRTPLWLLGPLEVRRTPTTLVLVHGSPAKAERYSRMARRAVPIVQRVVEWPDARLVVEVPESLEELESLLAATPGSYSGVAAVSASVDGSTTAGAPVHVFVNPAVFDTLRPEGAQVVLSHEATHVATDAAMSRTLPLWLLEGFADYVALRDVRLPLSTTAGQIIAQVRRSGPPEHLPGESEFDESSTGFGTAYEAAWYACRLLAELGGEDHLVALYDRVRQGEDVDQAMTAEFGFGTAEFTRTWQRRLAQLAER